MSFIVLDADASQESKLIAHDDLEAHMIATGKWGPVDFALTYISDLQLPNYDAKGDQGNAVVLVVVAKDDDPDKPLDVKGFIFAEGGTQYDLDGVWKDAMYYGRLADEVEEENASGDGSGDEDDAS